MTKTTRLLASAGVALAALAGAAIAQPAPDARPNLTRADAQARAAEMFARMDANKDGKLDQADRAAHEAERFAKLDANKDGALSRDEFAAGRPPRDGAGPRPGGPDGPRMAGGKRHGPGADGGRHGPGMMLRMADANKDNAVSRDEFLAAQAKHFDMMDGNKDGTVTADERKAARSKMREHMRGKRGGADKSGHEGH